MNRIIECEGNLINVLELLGLKTLPFHKILLIKRIDNNPHLPI
jgi:hypothetical protein